MTSAPRTITVLTRRKHDRISESMARVVDLAVEAGVKVQVPPGEAEKHRIRERDGVVRIADAAAPTDLSIVLGGDGTILSSLRLFAGTDVPTFAVNYGAIGFLSTVEHEQLDEGVRRALRGDYDVMRLPAITADLGDREVLAVNDISFHRHQNGRVAELAYSVRDEQLGEVRCDGLVISTPAGSTGYNLANGGPVMAWGVEGYVVSFIAPHTLTARALVVAPDDTMEVVNRNADESVNMTTDGRFACELAPGNRVRLRFQERRALLAQLPGATFYHRMRDKFGRLAY